LNTLSKTDFELLFNANSKKVFNICLNIVQSREDAEDIVQEVFIEVFHSFNTFSEKSAPSTWIYRIAVNKSIDFIRAKKRKKRFSFITQLFHPDKAGKIREISHFDHPAVILENKERTQILFRAINKLPENQKTAFVLHKIDGLPQKEIAQIMDISAKAVESLLQRSKENLKKLLGNYYHERGI
jgi:RNA polymerase sigma-70 factor, ECF subfamily